VLIKEVLIHLTLKVFERMPKVSLTSILVCLCVYVCVCVYVMCA
jgi:hypothetical protein